MRRAIVCSGHFEARSAHGDHDESLRQVSISLNFTDKDEQTRVWERPSKGGTITMPLAALFWGRFGVLTDRFGIQWMLNHEEARS